MTNPIIGELLGSFLAESAPQCLRLIILSATTTAAACRPPTGCAFFAGIGVLDNFRVGRIGIKLHIGLSVNSTLRGRDVGTTACQADHNGHARETKQSNRWSHQSAAFVMVLLIYSCGQIGTAMRLHYRGIAAALPLN